MQKYGQRQYMFKMFKEYRGDKSQVCAAYAQGERDGIVTRTSKSTDTTPEKYALALWNDGQQKGWLPF
jgi:hypothetical protein